MQDPTTQFIETYQAPLKRLVAGEQIDFPVVGEEIAAKFKNGKLAVIVGQDKNPNWATFQFLFVLASLDVTRIRQCAVCPGVFYAKDKRQEYCSGRCSSRQRTRRMRAAVKEKRAA